ncbi:DUF1194 domain-containing protein [uncultured Roseobacter sp.]|uniref:DUF1194 domain-containing protein n=1 Tax=uncultured Roseobacter sp. TaxID=114847 RepID=UPI002618BF93|nr:DUF1194 domain-containing protein [uncultured Roseobacter sp.]
MRHLLFSLALFAMAPTAQAQTLAAPLEVDVELVLAVDVSRSMSAEELEIQRRGYAEALTSPQVINAVTGGLLGRIAVTYVEWAGEYSQHVLVPWQLISGPAEAEAMAQTILGAGPPGLRRTSISGALLFAADAFENNGFEGLRRVIDVSGDGPNNQGAPVLAARDAVLARGIIINGLPLMTRDALSDMWGLPDLDEYYQDCVIGGTGAFVIPVLDWGQFAAAVRRKLVLEIAAPRAPARVVPAASHAPYDCLTGEKMWRENRPFLIIP